MTQLSEELRDTIKGTIEGVLSFAESECVPVGQEYREILENEAKLFGDDGRLDPEIQEARDEIRRKSGKAGYWAMFAPESIGGGGLGAPVASHVLEAVYRKYGGSHLMIGLSHGFLTSPIAASFVDGPSHMFTVANETIRTDIVPSLVAGEKTLCFGITEPDAGSDLWGLKCKARKEGAEWVINGTKQWITNSPYADYAAVFAVTNEEMLAQHKGGITCFLVDTKQPGVDTNTIFPVMGHVSSDCGSVILEDVRINEEYILGQVDQGFMTAMFGISEGRLAIAATCVGLAEWALDRCLEYVKERVTFGRPLADRQAIQWMLADSAIEIFGAKYATLRASELVDEYPSTGKVPMKEISLAKAHAVEMGQRVCDRAIQIHGAMGLSSEMGLEEAFRICRTVRIPDGTSEMQRRTIARSLLGGDTVF
ncbi:MAG: acyl-CoA dehydrogenase family protein [Dehalococcoidia bacterium]|nr:MAG: acyl-CoA dehydrogenase family protein [Dehalococcoidia bacterium]